MTSVTCPSNEQLQRLLDGTLGENEHDTLQQHVDACVPCQKMLEGLTAGSESWIGVVDELQQRTPHPEALLAEAMAKIKAEDPDEFTREAPPYRPSTVDLVKEFLTPTVHPGAIGRLGSYEVTEVIGHGGFGAVFKAFDPALHRVVAVKVLASHLAHHAVARKRFIREAQAAAAVCHENVVTIHAIEEAVANGPMSGAGSAQPKIVMQYVSGGSLQERLDQEGPLELKEILRIGMQTAAGLAAAHAQGLVHRDVKPGNILLENGVQRVKLTDFGLARVVDDASLTLSGVIAGTPQYMSPEQAWGRSVDHRGDLFSLGAVLYAMCVGHSPFRARSTMAVLKRVCEEQPRPIPAINPEIPDWLCEIIARLLSKSPEDRFQTAEEVGVLLGGYLAHVQQPTICPEPTGWRKDVTTVTTSVAAESAIPVATLVSPPPIKAPPRREPAKSSFWKWVVALLLLLPLMLFGMLVVLWLSYRAAAVESQRQMASAEQARLMAAEAAAINRQRAINAERGVRQNEPHDGIQSFDAAAQAALRGRWVVLSAEGPTPTMLRAIAPSNASGMIAPGMMMPGMTGGGLGTAGGMPGGASTTEAETRAPQLIEFTDQDVKVVTSRELAFRLDVLGTTHFVAHDLSALNGPISLSGTYLIDDDRLILSWGSSDVPPPQLAKSDSHQLLVCRREWTVSPSPRVVAVPTPGAPDSTIELGFVGSDIGLRAGDPKNPPRADLPFTDREAKALQAAWAKKLGVEAEITNSIGMKLKLIPPGKLAGSSNDSGSGMVGSSGGMPGMGGGSAPITTSPQDGVVAPMYVGVHEVTRKQFQTFVDETGYVTDNERALAADNFAAGARVKHATRTSPRCSQLDDSHPVIEITDDDATAFTHWLSRKEKRTYRLLAVNEWEFVARAGQTRPLAIGVDKLKSRSQFFSSTAAVGSYPANAFGLHDLIGNAAEITWSTALRPARTVPVPQSSPGAFTYGTAIPLQRLLSPFVSGGDYATTIELSQPNMSLDADQHADHVLKMAIGFRVAIDLSADSLLSHHMSRISTGDDLVPLQVTAQWCDLPLAPTDDQTPAATTRKLVVLVRDVIAPTDVPYAVEWTDIEIERADRDDAFNPLTHGVSFKTRDVAAWTAALQKYEVDSDPVQPAFLDKVLTAPLIKARPSLKEAASHALLDEQPRGPSSGSAKWEFSDKLLVRFYDFDAPSGQHCVYRYRLKYRLPHLSPEIVHATGWRNSNASVAIPAK